MCSVHVNPVFSSLHSWGHISSFTSSTPSSLPPSPQTDGSNAPRFTLLPGDRQPPSVSQSEAVKNRLPFLHWSAAPGNSFHYQWPCHCVVWQCWSQLYCPLSLFRLLFLQQTPFTDIRALTHTHTHTHRHTHTHACIQIPPESQDCHNKRLRESGNQKTWNS